MNLNFLRLSPTARYAMRGMAYLALLPEDRYALADEIAAAEKLPRHFLSKILQRLAQCRFLRSRRGPGGGYALAVTPSAIPVQEILAALQESPYRVHCFVENRDCDAVHPCPMHEAAGKAASLLHNALMKMTLADLLEKPSHE